MKDKGITMVSLVTIIILIILAGVSLNLTIGENGIVTMAKKAKENMELAQIEEETKLNELYTQLGNEGEGLGELDYDAIAKMKDFKKAIADYIKEAGGVQPDYTADTIMFGESIKGIVKEVTKDATATADNITEGKTAWVNGIQITGNGKDVQSSTSQSITFRLDEGWTGSDQYFDVSNYHNMDLHFVAISDGTATLSIFEVDSLGAIPNYPDTDSNYITPKDVRLIHESTSPSYAKVATHNIGIDISNVKYIRIHIGYRAYAYVTLY